MGALHHKDIGDIDLVWGKEGTAKSDGFGLAKLAKYHPEVLGNLQEILDTMVVVKRTDNRVQLESETHQASVRLTWDGEKKNWLLTAFEKKNSVSDNTTDTVGTAESGKRNDTATPQNTVSDGKDTEKDSENKGKEGTIAGKDATDSQGNPLNADGTLKLERVKSVDDLTDEEVAAITAAMKANATVAPTVEVNDENWKETVNTPIGNVKMGENQKAKLFAKGREQQYGMVLETLSHPDVVLEEKDKEQNMFHERPSSYLFVKTFQKKDGSKYVHFESVTVSNEGMEVSISSHIIRENQLKNKLKSDRLLYKATALDAPANTSAEQPIIGGSLSSERQAEREDGQLLILPSEQSEEAGALSSRTPDLSSDGKDNKVLDTKQENLSEIEKQQGADELRNDTAAKQLATNAVLDALGNAGISVEVVSDEVASEMLGRNEAKAESANEEALETTDHVQFMRMGGKKKSTPETASPDNQDQPTVVSSADGANILKSLDSEIKKYENVSSYPKTFIGDVSRALGATRQGSASEYASFETKSGKTVTIRLSNHNAKVSTFDAHDEAEGISIVVTPKENKGISNDGHVHVTEFYYNAIKLRRADGKPLVEILKSIKQALYSGAYTDNTGLAEVKEVNVPTASDGQTDSGKVYGWTADGKIFLTKDGINPNTPIHEYTHLWAGAMRQRNEKGWQRVKNLLKGTPIWDEVLNDPNYRSISADEDAVASEALSRISGRENAKKMEAEAQRMIDEADGIAEKAEAVSFFLKDAGNGLYNLTEVCGTKKREPKRKELFQDRKERYQPASYGV